MNPEVSRACAALKNHLNLPPGDELDRLIAAAQAAQTVEQLPAWVRNGLRNMNYRELV